MQKPTKSTERQPEEQVKRFLETARAFGCDEDKEKFEAALGKIAAHRPRVKGKKEADSPSTGRGEKKHTSETPQ
jgi:hypothetical protein